MQASLVGTKWATVQPAQTFINPLTQVVRIIHARSNTAAEHPLTLVVMTLAFRDDRTRGYAVVAREESSRSTVFIVYIMHM